jgi:hypothetical protein
VSTVIRTECGSNVIMGDVVYNYYDMWAGTIVCEPDDQGWFYVQPLSGGQKALLNGQRICTLAFARMRGFPGADPIV